MRSHLDCSRVWTAYKGDGSRVQIRGIRGLHTGQRDSLQRWGSSRIFRHGVEPGRDERFPVRVDSGLGGRRRGRDPFPGIPTSSKPDPLCLSVVPVVPRVRSPVLPGLSANDPSQRWRGERREERREREGEVGRLPPYFFRFSQRGLVRGIESDGRLRL